MEKKAHAMVFDQINEPFTKISFNYPKLKDSEALIKITYTTICTSDLHTFFGRRNSPQHSILGHEIIGKIEDIPENGVKDYNGDYLKIGDSVTWSVYAHDKDDPYAKIGIPQKSLSLFKYGHEKINQDHQLNGGFATHCHLTAGSTIFKLPEHLTLKESAPLNCTHATVAGAIRLAGDFKGKNVLICGVGMLGLSACAMAKEAGANLVFAMDIDNDRLKKSKTFGADIVLQSKDELSELQNITKKNSGIDIVIETSGVPIAIENTLKMLNIGGTLVLVGSVYSQRDLSINAETLVRRLLTIKGLHNYIHQDLAYAINFLAENSKKYPFEQLVSHEFPLGDLDNAFNYANSHSCYRVGVTQNHST